MSTSSESERSYRPVPLPTGETGVSEERSRLLAYKEDVYATLRVLQQDHADGNIDDDAYQESRTRYELEAAGVLEQLDRLDATASETQREQLTRHLGWVSSSMLVLLGIAIVLLLVTALHGRTGASANGAVQQPAPAPASPRLRAAQRAATEHPTDVNILLSLGNAYLDAGDEASADAVFQRCIQLAPSRPEAPTQHAFVLAATGSKGKAFSLLHRVEVQHPTYARAWLVDGLVASGDRHTMARAVVALNRFLVLQPHSGLTPMVRDMLTRAQRSKRKMP